MGKSKPFTLRNWYFESEMDTLKTLILNLCMDILNIQSREVVKKSKNFSELSWSTHCRQIENDFGLAKFWHKNWRTRIPTKSPTCPMDCKHLYCNCRSLSLAQCKSHRSKFASVPENRNRKFSSKMTTLTIRSSVHGASKWRKCRCFLGKRLQFQPTPDDCNWHRGIGLQCRISLRYPIHMEYHSAANPQRIGTNYLWIWWLRRKKSEIKRE